MLSIYNRASLDTALAQTDDLKLRTLIASRLGLAEANGLAELTHILAIQPDDDEAAIATEIGFSPLVSTLDGVRYGSADFQPYWSWLQDVGGWFEMIVTAGNSGFAFVLLMEDSDRLMPQLRELCEEYSQCG